MQIESITITEDELKEAVMMFLAKRGLNITVDRIEKNYGRTGFKVEASVIDETPIKPDLHAPEQT